MLSLPDRVGSSLSVNALREVDFIVIDRNVPVLIVECKFGDGEIDRGLKYSKPKFPQAEAWQLSAIGRKEDVSEEGIRVDLALALLNDWLSRIARHGLILVSC